MKRFVVLISLALVLVVVAGAMGTASALTNSENGKTRVIVEFTPGKKAVVENALKAAGAEFHYSFDNLNAFAVTLPATALNGISHNPNVVLVEEDALRFPISIMQSAKSLSLPEQEVPYGVDLVQARDVWDANRDGVVDSGAPTGSNRTLCIIDSGLYTGHEDFQGVSASGYDGNLQWDEDGLGHGTHVAGTIAAVNNNIGVVGVTPGMVHLYIVRVFGNDGAWTYSSSLIDAANRCAAAGANIISMSLSGTRANNTERKGFDALYAQGILSIAAASNDGISSYAYPASYTSVVSVGALDESMQWAEFSNFNDQVELAGPGVGVLSTVPYLDISQLIVDGVTYSANHIENSARGTVSAALVFGGLCDVSGAWSGKVVVCERGDISFYDKVMNVQNSGGIAALIYNNEPGNFLGTLGDGASSTIVALSLSQEDGQDIVANKLGLTGQVSSEYFWPESSYEYYDGTSMATPHVSAVAALVWSADPTATNQEIRDVLDATALDLGAAGRDVYYGFGLVQAADAVALLTGGGGDGELHVSDIAGYATIINARFWNATFTVTVMDANNVAVANATVSGSYSGAYTGSASCITNSAGECSVTTGNVKVTTPVTFTVTNLAADGYIYNATANAMSAYTVSR